MRKKRLLILLGAFITALPAMAQWSIGASGGYALNIYDYDPQYMTGMEYNVHHGFTADIPVQYQINNWLYLSSGLSVHQKGYVLHGRYVPVGGQEPCVFYPRLVRNDYYVSLPLMADFVFGDEKWRGFVGLGGYVGWWASSVFVYKEIQSIAFVTANRYIHQNVKLNKDVDRRVELGLVGEIGLQRSLNNCISLFAASRCFYAITPQQLDYQAMHFPSRNITLSVQVGILFNLKNY